MKSGRKLETSGWRMGCVQRMCFKYGQLGHIAKECTKRTAVETKGRSDGSISKDNIRSYGGNDVKYFSCGKKGAYCNEVSSKCFVL